LAMTDNTNCRGGKNATKVARGKGGDNGKRALPKNSTLTKLTVKTEKEKSLKKVSRGKPPGPQNSKGDGSWSNEKETTERERL